MSERGDEPDDGKDGAAGPKKDGDAPEGKSGDAKSGDAKPDEDKSEEDEPEDDKAKKPSVLKKPWVRFALIVAAIILLIVGIVYLIRYETHGKYLQSTNDAMVDANVVTVAPQVNGYVTKVFVDDNQDVRAGQPLLKIDARDYEAQVAQYNAQIAVSLANADNYRAQVREQRATVAQSRQQYLSSLAQARFQESEARRYAPLAATGAETKEKAAQYRSQAKSTRHTADADLANAVSAERKIASLQAQVRQALAQAASAQAQLVAAQVNEGLTLIRAAIGGRVGDKTVRTGQYVSAGTKLMSLVPLDGLYVTANFKETQVGLMRVGEPATITVDALPGAEFDGHVISASPGTGAQFSLLPPQNATGNFTKIVQRVPVRIGIDAGPEARKVLVPGLSVTVVVDTVGAKASKQRMKDQQQKRRDERANDRKLRTDQVRQANP